MNVLTLSTIAACLLTCMFPFAAQAETEENLIGHAMPNENSPLGNTQALMEKWLFRSETGADPTEYLGGTDNYPKSCFSKIGDAYRYVYGGDNQINGETFPCAEGEGFNIGDYIVILDYPFTWARNADGEILNGDHYEEYNYNIPINIPYEGEYTLSGAAKYRYKDAKRNVTDNYMDKTNRLVIVGVKSLGKLNFETHTADGITYLDDVKDASGESLPYIRKHLFDRKTGSVELPDYAKPFSESIHLTPDIKYLSFYAPKQSIALNNLKLVSNAPVGVGAIAAEDTAEPEYYTLQGIKVSGDNLPVGIYIVKTGTKVTKRVVTDR